MGVVRGCGHNGLPNEVPDLIVCDAVRVQVMSRIKLSTTNRASVALEDNNLKQYRELYKSQLLLVT